MKTINLFVACPKDSDNLKSLKEDIKKKCLDLNVYFAKTIKGKNEAKKVKIIPVTYDDPERREEVCKQIIKYRADIVLFLFDDMLDEYLLDELEFAVERSIKFNKPEPLVYVNKSNDHFTDNKLDNKIAEILAEGGWIYEPFYEPVDLWGKVLYKIERYFNQYFSIRRIQRKAKWRYYALPIAIILIIIGAVLFACRPLLRNKMESKQLLIMGGGSAINYIVEHTPSIKSKDELNTLRWHYAAMASGNSYGIISEEVIKNYNGYKSHPYYPIVLSAKEATQDDFLKSFSPKEFQKAGIVVGIKMGEDWLVAYGNKGAFDKEMLISDTAIRDTSLTTIIAKQVELLRMPTDSTTNIKRVFVYTTSENSGTLNSYFKTCDGALIREYFNICDSLKIERPPFSDIDILPKHENASNWIALGSKYYHPNNNAMDSLTVVINEGGLQVQTKKIYVYFMLYKNNDNNQYILPRATKRFLKKIQLPDTTIDSLNNPEIISRIINDSTILYDSVFKNYKTKK